MYSSCCKVFLSQRSADPQPSSEKRDQTERCRILLLTCKIGSFSLYVYVLRYGHAYHSKKVLVKENIDRRPKIIDLIIGSAGFSARRSKHHRWQQMISRAEIEKNRKENLPPKRQMDGWTGKTIKQLCAERTKRVRDAIELRVPDRVPFSVFIEPHACSGIFNSASCYDAITLQGNRGDSPLRKEWKSR